MLTIIYALFRFVSSLIALLLTIVLIFVTAFTYNNAASILSLFINLADIEISVQSLSVLSAVLVFLIGISLLILIFGSIAWKIKVERHLADIRIQNSRILRLLESDSRSYD
ncbi:MAG: hypothetical protein SPJ34_07155 [Candidatus Ornithospirochaeta sp.]|nr:hypothetical protein [Candidatus Ornithospirochaeta sp.]